MRGPVLKMARDNVLEGVFAINKPMGMSSAQVIRDCQTYFNPSAVFAPLVQREVELRARESKSQQRRRSRVKRDMRVKMGHGGTLDPLATGVLLLGVGHGTKELHRFLLCTKTYETVVLFGASTDTYDRVGRILKKKAYGDISRAAVEAALDRFRGRFRQMPPLYSALKMNGKPLYEYAREGLAIPRAVEDREVDVSELTLLEWYPPGTHPHRWPADEAGLAEQSLAERVWRLERDQAAGRTPAPLSEAEERDDRAALAAHEDFKRRAEEKQDELVFDRPPKRKRGAVNSNNSGNSSSKNNNNNNNTTTTKTKNLMSGALGELPSSPYHKTTPADATGAADAVHVADADTPQRPHGRGSNLIPPPPDPSAPPPWDGPGPPAARIRLTVSSGFYVRSFCHDLGEAVGSVAMMAELARVRQGDFHAGSANCLEYDDLLRGEAVWAPEVERLLALWNEGEVAAAGLLPRHVPEEKPKVESKADEVEKLDGKVDKTETQEATEALPTQGTPAPQE